MFKRNYHIVFFVSDEDKSYFGSVNLTVKGKFVLKEVQEYLEENRKCKKLVIFNWKKI